MTIYARVDADIIGHTPLPLVCGGPLTLLLPRSVPNFVKITEMPRGA